VALDAEILENAASVNTVSYSMSVSEMITMYKDKELNLHPEFQRFFRWTIEQKSRLVESLLLGIPVPPVFVSEREDSKWDVIDGLQRLSTILELVGELQDEKGTPKPPLQLTKTHYLPSLDGVKWVDEDPMKALTESARIKVKRARLDVNIVKSTSDSDVKYEVFQRLNTGGASATDQEVRNCLLVMANPDYFSWLKRLSEKEEFRGTLSLTDRAIDEAFDMELVARFLAFVSSTIDDLRGIDELGSFLNRIIVKQAKQQDFPREAIERAFDATFHFLFDVLKEDSFRKYDHNRARYLGPMAVSTFEVVAIGLGHHLLHGGALPTPEEFSERHRNLWADLSAQPYVGSGIRASTRVPQTVEFGRRWVNR
jgi:hypothetical protein